MNNKGSHLEQIDKYAVNDDQISPFEKAIPNCSEKLSIELRRISYKNRNGITKIISLDKDNKYLSLVFRVFAAGFQTSWFDELGENTKATYFREVGLFFKWVNATSHDTNDKTKYQVLKDYEVYALNEKRLKKSPLQVVLLVLKEGLSKSHLGNSEYNYVNQLTHLSKSSVSTAEPIQLTLTNWFDTQWLSSIVGDEIYHQLESPRRLFNSFRVTIATTLFWLLEQRDAWRDTLTIEFKPSRPEWQYQWGPLFFTSVIKFKRKDKSTSDLTELALLDLVKPSYLLPLQKRVVESATPNSAYRFKPKLNGEYPWQVPMILHPEYQNRYSPLEELLCAWLIACDAIQPTDIPKLKTNSYAREYNHLGRLIAMECTYYKGRSGSSKTSNILMGQDIWTRTLARYMDGLQSPELFSTNVARKLDFPFITKRKKINTRNTTLRLLLNVWKLDSFKEKFNRELNKADASPLFLTAMLALQHGDEPFTVFHHHTKRSFEEYLNSVSKPLPRYLFSLTHIKNTAVHANSDAYREGDLVNHHSHTSLTEKTAYMTDANKEWVNQCGRFTRLVLHDLQNVVFNPSINQIEEAVHDMELFTKLEEAVPGSDLQIHSISTTSVATRTRSEIVVSDSLDTALYFIHYISQAEKNLNMLLHTRPDFVERTLIIQIEWMTRTLTRMKHSASAKKAYSSIASHLPPLFDHLLDSIE